MLESALLLAFSGLMALLCLATAAWVAATAQGLTTDDLLLIGVSLTLAAFFGFNVAWSVRTGEFREVMNDLRERRSKSGPAETPPGEPKT